MVLIDAKAPMMKFDDYFEAIDEDDQKKISTLKPKNFCKIPTDNLINYYCPKPKTYHINL